jgi:formylmethanofuran dehydrogenase subunit E
MWNDGRAPRCSKCKKVTYQHGLTDDDKVLCLSCMEIYEDNAM